MIVNFNLNYQKWNIVVFTLRLELIREHNLLKCSHFRCHKHECLISQPDHKFIRRMLLLQIVTESNLHLRLTEFCFGYSVHTERYVIELSPKEEIAVHWNQNKPVQRNGNLVNRKIDFCNAMRNVTRDPTNNVFELRDKEFIWNPLQKADCRKQFRLKSVFSLWNFRFLSRLEWVGFANRHK